MPTDSSSSSKPGNQPAARQPLPQARFQFTQQPLPPYPIPPVLPRHPPNAQPTQPYYTSPPFQPPPLPPYAAVQQPYAGYLYQPPPQYSYIPNPNPPTILNPNAQSSYRNAPAPRQPPPSISVPTPEKKILSIVDPETNEEVKILPKLPPKRTQQAEPVRAPLEIPARTSKALELVPDPADAPEPSPASENKLPSTEPTPKPSSLRGPSPPVVPEVQPLSAIPPETPKQQTSTAPQATTTAPVLTVQAASPEHKSSNIAPTNIAPITSSETAPEPSTDDNKETTLPSTPVDASPALKPSTPAEIEIMTSDVSSSTVLDPNQEERDDLPQSAVEPDSLPPSSGQDTIPPSADSVKSPKLTKDVPPPSSAQPEPPIETAVNEAEPVETLETSPTVSEAKTISAKSPAPDTSVTESPISQAPVPTQENGDASAKDENTTVDDQPTSETEESATNSSSPPRRARPSFLVDGRLTYPPTFMWEMRGKISPRKISEYDTSVRDGRDIFKGEYGSGSRADPRMQTGRNRPYASDPRSRYSNPGSAPFGSAFGPPHGSSPGGRSYPSLDLSVARAQALPPPERKGQPPPMDFDPRGSKTQLPRGRYDHSRHSNVDPFINRPPVEKLKRSENGWKRNKEADDEITARVKRVRSLLNKLTLEKFEKIFKQIIEIEINSFDLLDRIVKEIFEKTLFEPEFSGMYAELCRRLDIHLAEPLRKANLLDADSKPIPFKTILVNNCRDEFTRFAESAESKDEEKNEDDSSSEKPPAENKPKKEVSTVPKEEAELKATKAKRRMLANVRFISELYLKDLLREKVIHRYCIQRLLKLGIESKEEDVLEALCKLVSKTGAKISTNPGASKVINEYFCRFDYLSRDFTLPARIRFMIQDLVDQRANGWKVRRQKTSAKTIAEIHKQAKEEERKKHEAQQAARERRGRGGMGSRDRAPQGFVPRMTMPSEPRSTSGQTRLDRTLERQPSRSLSGISGGFSVSLRPGTSASRVGSLRPGGSSFGSFGVLSDKDASGATQAADPRRVKSTFWQPVSRRPQHQVAPKAPTPKSALMDPQVLKRKAKGAMEEYWSNPSVSEVQEILADEVKAPNYKGFVHEALMATFSSKITHQEKSIELFAGLVDSPIEGTIFCECFSKLVRKLSDMEIDNPRCGEFLGRFIGATAATSKLDPSNRKDFGLKFLGRDLQEVKDPKRRANLAVHTFTELSGRLSASVPDEKEREDMVRQVAERLHIDLAADMCLWNPMRGLSKLSDMLSQNNISFLVPYLALEGQLKELIESKAPGEKIENLLRSNSKTADTSLMRVIVRVGLDCLFMSSADTIVESFKRYVGSPVIKVYGTLPRELQFSILLAAQVYIGRSVNFLPPLSDASSKHGGLALQALHDSGMVESTVLLRWKKDTGESQEVGCKNEMVEQTERFFERLAK